MQIIINEQNKKRVRQSLSNRKFNSLGTSVKSISEMDYDEDNTIFRQKYIKKQHSPVQKGNLQERIRERRQSTFNPENLAPLAQARENIEQLNQLV
jgi:hypothetical protein